jgi:hypothetical protein
MILIKYYLIGLFVLFTFVITAQSQDISFKQAEIGLTDDKNIENVIIMDDFSSITSKEFRIPITNPDPFLGVAFKLYGNNLSEENIIIEVRSDFENEWIQFGFDDDVENLEGELTSGLQFFDKNSNTIQFKISLKEETIDIERIVFSFISPGKTADEVLEQIRKYEPEINFIPDMDIKRDRNQIFDLSKMGKAASYPRPPVITRTEWGCPQGQGSLGNPSLTSPTHLIVHHSAGTSSSNDWPAVVRAIYTLHTQSNGWSDIGYNWLIDANGVVYQGRAWWQNTNDNVLGAHFCGKNSNTMGVCVMGTYTSVSPTEAAKTSLAEILAYKADERNINPFGSGYHAASGLTLNNISGHRNGCATECPGTNLYNQLPTIRSTVYELLNPTSVENEENIPDGFYLAQNYPNPFNPSTTIRFVIPNEVRNLKDFSSQTSRNDNALVSLKVFDVLGNEVAVLVNKNKPAGSYELEFNAAGLSSGVYFYTLTADGLVQKRKMILLQ